MRESNQHHLVRKEIKALLADKYIISPLKHLYIIEYAENKKEKDMIRNTMLAELETYQKHDPTAIKCSIDWLEIKYPLLFDLHEKRLQAFQFFFHTQLIEQSFQEYISFDKDGLGDYEVFSNPLSEGTHFLRMWKRTCHNGNKLARIFLVFYNHIIALIFKLINKNMLGRTLLHALSSFITTQGKRVLKEMIFWGYYHMSFYPDWLLKFIFKLLKVLLRPAQHRIIRKAEKFIDADHAIINWARKIINGVRFSCSRGFVINIFVKWFMQKSIKKDFRDSGKIFPDFISISPSTACNLKCKGCYAGSHSKQKVISEEKMNDIIDQGRRLGTIVICITGGEPLLYPPLLRILKKNKDMYFLIYTNGTLVDEKFCEEISTLGNATILLSIEGGKEQTDFRRGKQCFEKVTKAAELLKKYKVIFGYTITISSNNADFVANEAFFKYLTDTGAFIIWLSTYVPVGVEYDLSMIPEPRQRVKLHNIISTVRKYLPILIIDFENDSRYVRGCTGAGRRFLHINNDGNIEPCNFLHYFQDNIYEKSLVDALESDLFCEIRRLQPFCDCAFTPCLLDCNADSLREIIQRVKPKCSYDGADVLMTSEEYIEFSSKYRNEIQDIYNCQNMRSFMDE